MKKVVVCISFILLITFHETFPVFNQIYGLEDSHFKRIAISKFDSSFLYAASKNSLFKSKDNAESFQKIAVFKDEEIQHIFFDSYLSDVLFIVTTRHLYKFRDKLEKIYSSFDNQEIYTAVKHKGKIFIGTSGGIYYSAEDLLNWSKLKSLRENIIFWIESDFKNDRVLIASDKGVYILLANDTLNRVFVLRQEEGDDRAGLIPKIIKINVFNSNEIWLGTNRGLFVSKDSGINWKKLYITGLNNLEINSLEQTELQKNTLYLGSNKGFFEIDTIKKKSKEIFEGLNSSYIYWVRFTPRGEIYLATKKGLFKKYHFTSFQKKNTLIAILNKEPSIRDVHERVMRYNQVHPEKMEKWRKSLKYRGLFPKMDLDYDKTIYGTAGTSTYNGKSFVGPRDWGVSFSWDLGDLLWNDYEDDIDTRVRLNTQLRLDILDEINRVYFERLRLKKEINDADFEVEKFFEKELRLKELTAMLDGYTGGYFSDRLDQLNERVSEN